MVALRRWLQHPGLRCCVQFAQWADSFAEGWANVKNGRKEDVRAWLDRVRDKVDIGNIVLGYLARLMEGRGDALKCRINS